MKKHLLFLSMFFFSYIAMAQVAVYWRADGPSNGSWEYGSTCEGSGTDGQWYYNSWGGNRSRPDCFGKHDIYFDNNAVATMNLNGLTDFGVRRIFFTANATSSRTLNSSDSRTLWLSANNGNPKIENNSTATHIFNVPIKLEANSEFNPVSGGLTFTSLISNNGYWIDIWGGSSNTLLLSGGLTGTGGLSIKNNTLVKYASATTYTGDTYIEAGILEVCDDMSSSSITVKNGAKLQINGTDVDIQNLIIETGGYVEILPGKSLTVNGTLTNNGTLTLKSDATNGTGSLVTNGGVTNGGTTNYNIEQYLTGGRNWYISSPVSNGTLVLAGFERNEPTAAWDPISSGASTTIGKGYIVQPGANGNITFSGTINDNEPSLTLSRTTGVEKEGFNLIGNPYPAYLDWTKAYTQNISIMPTSTMWYRTYTGGAYAFWTVNGASGVGSPTDASYMIPPAQAFWVRANANNVSFSFTKAMRSHATTTNMMKSKAANNSILSIARIKVSNGINSDETVLYVHQNASNDMDMFDSEKMSNNDATRPEIFTKINADELAINGMSNLPLDTEIPLGFRTEQQHNFEFSVTEFSGFDSNIKLVIKDAVAQAEQELFPGHAYSFTSKISNSTSRFSLIFKSNNTTTENKLPVYNQVYVYKNSNKKLVVKLNEFESRYAQIIIYNTTGQKVHEQTISANETVIYKELKAGIYLVKVKNGTSEKLLKAIIE